jgi:DNA-directed RNA polymerase specialized sigma subunit
MNVAQYTELDTLLLDKLADGQWHPSTKIWSRFGDEAKLLDPKVSKKQMLTMLDELVEKEVLLSGANQSYRFVTRELELWRLLSPTLDLTSLKDTPRYFGGILEDDGWQRAPLRECHLVHFKASRKLSKTELSKLVSEPMNMINLNEDGLYKIYSRDKETTYNRVKELKIEFPEYEISGIRLEANLRRRSLDELHQRYLSELCRHYGQFAKVLLRGQMSSIKKHLPEDDDAQQQIYLWVIEAVKRYDDSTSIPFAAYLGTSIKKWVYDLNRKSYGRSIADKELKHSRAINEFRATEERNPTAEELARILNIPVDEVNREKEDINTVVNLRNQKAIEYDDFELPLPAEDQTDAHLDNLIESTILSASITTASKLPNGKRNIAGLVAIYYKTWGVDVENKRIRSWMRSKSTVQALDDITSRAEQIIVDTRREEHIS